MSKRLIGQEDRWSGRLGRAIGLIAIFAAIGSASAVVRLKYFSSIDDIRIGAWESSSLIGSSQASSFLRAAVAVNGILALTRAQAIYFSASADDKGQPLRAVCRYRIVGHDLPARWWSITAYGSDRFLIANAEHRYSASKDSVAQDANGMFSILVSQNPESTDWIYAGQSHFILTLRVYDPEADFLATTAPIELPKIEREHCV